MTASHIAIASPDAPGNGPRKPRPASRPRTYNRIRILMVHAPATASRDRRASPPTRASPAPPSAASSADASIPRSGWPRP